VAFVLYSALGAPGVATAQQPDSAGQRNRNPWVALGLGIVIPGGGQFYLGDWSGGIQAVVTDLILFEALRRSETSARGMIFFLGSVHLVEGLFAAQACREERKGRSGIPPAAPPPQSVSFIFYSPHRDGEAGQWRFQMALSVPLTR